MARTQEWKMTSSNGLLLLLALVAGLVAAAIVFAVVSESEGEDSAAPPAGNTVPALVAAQSMGAGTEITADMVKVIEVPEDLFVSGAYAESEAVVGEVTKVAISEGEQITVGKIGLAVPDKGLSGVVASGMRAVSIDVNEVTAVGGNLLPGDRVDILATVRYERAPGLAEDEYLLSAMTVLQDVEVLSVAQEAQEPAAQSTRNEEGDTESASYTSGQLPDDIDPQPNAGTLTLAVTPEQALSIVSIQEWAIDVWAVLRAYGDQGIVELPPCNTVIVED
jgi:pilus assembly protein CpaB